MRDSALLLQDGFLGKLTTLRGLQFLAGFSDQEAAELCFVSHETYRRWRSDRAPNPMAVRLMSIMAGYVPWRGWRDWEMHDGILFPPGYFKHGIGPGDILAIPFNLQLLAEHRRQLEQLRTEVGRSKAGQW